MRIIAGEYKGFQLPQPKSSQLRPTQEKVRGQIFNICQHEIEGAHVLDLFAGTGALGLEALSRGAASCLFVEKIAAHAALIHSSIQKLNISQVAQVLTADVITALSKIEKKGGKFSLCLLDPPYSITHPANGPYLVKTLQLLERSNILQEGALVVVEDSTKSPIDTLILTHLLLVDTRKGGDTSLRLFRYCEKNIPLK